MCKIHAQRWFCFAVQHPYPTIVVHCTLIDTLPPTLGVAAAEFFFLLGQPAFPRSIASTHTHVLVPKVDLCSKTFAAVVWDFRKKANKKHQKRWLTLLLRFEKEGSSKALGTFLLGTNGSVVALPASGDNGFPFVLVRRAAPSSAPLTGHA